MKGLGIITGVSLSITMLCLFIALYGYLDEQTTKRRNLAAKVSYVVKCYNSDGSINFESAVRSVSSSRGAIDMFSDIHGYNHVGTVTGNCVALSPKTEAPH